MPPPEIAASEKYVYGGIARIYWAVAVANISAPTRSEMNAGLDLSPECAEASGWEVTSEIITDPNWGNFATQRIGIMQVGEPQLLMWADRAGDDIRTTLSRGTVGHILILHAGDVAGNEMDVFPVRVAAMPKPMTIDGVAHLLVKFAVTSKPAENVVIPAL